MNKIVKTCWWCCNRINPLLSLTGIVLSVLVPRPCSAGTVPTLPYAFNQIAGWLPNPVVTNTLTGLVSNGPAIFSIDQYPALGLLTQQPGFSTNGQWTYQPFSTNFSGSDYFLFSVADTNGNVSVPGLVTIVPTNQPYAISQSVSWLKGASPTNTLQGFVATGLTNFTVLHAPINGLLVNLPGFSTNGRWQYQPTNAPIFSGADSFTFMVTDSLGNTSTPAVVSIFVTNLPYANSQSVGWMQGTFPTNRLTGDVASGPTNFTIVQNPLYGQITLLPGFATNGFWKFQPYATNFFGTDSFTFKVQDSNGSNSLPGLISITVTNVTVAPYAHYQYLKTRPGQPLTISLSGDDDGNDPLFPTNSTPAMYAHTRDMRSWNPVFTVLTFPTNGTLTGTAPNLIYTPSKTNVFDSFTFKVNNGALDSQPATVMIKVATYNIGTNYFDLNFSSNMTNCYQTNDVSLANFGTVRPGFEGWAFSSTNGTVTPDYAGTPMTGSDRTDDGFINISNFMDRLKRPKFYNFFGRSFTNFFINNNGLLSFSNGVPTYASYVFPTPFGFPLIAPLWQDVDTRGGGGAVTYGLGYVTDSLDGAPGRPALIITWPDVGSYYETTNPLNRFQVALIDRSDINVGDFDVEFNYEYIHWLNGQASLDITNNPSAGFDAGDYVNYYNLPGANTTNVLDFPTNSNVLVPGRFELHMNGDSLEPFCENIAVTSIGTTNALLSAQFGANPYGTNTAWFYVSNTLSGVTTNIFAGNIPPTGAGLVQVATNVGNLQSGTKYYVNAYASSPHGDPLGNTIVFPNTSTYFSTVPRLVALVPNVGTLTPAFNPNITSYSLSDPNGSSIAVTPTSDEPADDFILYQINGGTPTAIPSGAPTPAAVFTYGANLLNLTVISSYGSPYSLTNIYTVVITLVPKPPTLTAEPVTSISSSNATLNAQVTANGSATTVYFEWGTTSVYGSTNAVAAQGSSGSMPVSLTLSNLAEYTGYHYQIVASNTAGITSSGDLTFTTSAGAPLATTIGTNNVTIAGATLLGAVNPEGAASGWYFEYGPTTSYGLFTATNTIAAGGSSVPVSAAITGLSPATTYHFALVATNSIGTSTGGDFVFQTPPPQPPTLTAEPVTSIAGSNATLNAQVNPNSLATTVYFEWGTTSVYGSTNTVAAGASGAPVPVSDTLSNLAVYTVYHYQIVASNTAGTTSSGDLTFTSSAGAPLVITIGTTNVTGTSATLLGTVNPEGAASGWYFQYGASTSFVASFTATNTIAASGSSVPVSIVISGLSPGTTYYFALIATNSTGTGTGAGLAFQTSPPLPPTLTVEPVTSIAGSNATLNAQVNPNNLDTTVYFEWGTTSVYGSTNTIAAGASGAPVPLSDTLSNLALYTIYHYQIVASNALGTASSGDLTFTSAYSPLTVLNWWRLGEADSNAVAGGTATTTIDSAGSENLTVYGGATYSTNVSGAAASSVSSSLTMCFTNGASYAGGSYAPTSATTNFGFEMWVYTISTSDNPTLFYNGNTGGNGFGLGEIGNSYRILFGDIVFASVGTVIPNTWTHIAVICQNGTAVLYTNGIAAGSVSAVPLPASGSLSIGGDPDGAGNYFDGWIDEVRIFTFSQGTFSTNYLLLNTPDGVPAVSSVTAMNISTNGATLSATITPNVPYGASVGAWFELGLTTNYGTVTATNTVLAGSAQSVSNALAGLNPGTLYHFRADALGLNPPLQSGLDQTFVTLDVPRTISALPLTAGGQFSLQFVGGPSVSYTILGTTNLTLPVSNWTILGTPVIVSNNIYQFTDPSATNGSQYYMLKNP